MNVIFKIILVSFVILSGTFTYVFAGIGVEPALIEISVRPEDIVNGKLLINNHNDQEMKIKAEAEYFFRPPKLNGEELNISSWLTLKPREFILSAGEIKEVDYYIKLPRGFSGEALAQIYFSSADAPDEKDKVMVRARFGVGLYVAAKDTEILKARISKIDVLREDDEIKYAIEVENLGNVHLRPRGKIIIEDLEGNEIQRLETQYGWPVFPDSKYTYDTEWQDLNLAAGKYRAKIIIEYVNPYDEKINRGLEGQIVFAISGDGQVAIAKERGEKNAL